MYPWHQSFSSWAKGTGLRIDALGLVTLLGAEEMDRSIGRLMPSEYFDYLPLLGAFVVAGDRFTEKKTGFILYNISAGIVTTELAGWVSRWIRAQGLYKVRSKVKWEAKDRPIRWTKFLVGFISISLPIHGMLLALTVLSADWWGFANVVSMIISVAVRCGQVSQNQAGIDANIGMAEREARNKMTNYEEALQQFEDLQRAGSSVETRSPPPEPKDFHDAKVLMVTEDSNILTLVAPNYLIKAIFTTSPRIPNSFFYLTCRAIGWAAFAVHVISIGMAQLPVQICSVVLIIVATVLTSYKVGCEDSKILRNLRNHFARGNKDDEALTCWVTSRLKATISSYPEEWSVWTQDEPKVDRYQEANVQKGSLNETGSKSKTFIDIESLSPPIQRAPIQERRQDLYAWLDLTEEQDKCLIAWGLIPHNRDWQNGYQEKKGIHRQREMRKQGRGTE